MTTSFGSASDFGLPKIETGDDILLSFPAASPAEGYLVQPAGHSGTLRDYTLIFDLRIPQDVQGSFGALLQTDLSNGSDGDLFLRKSSADTAGIGISGQYEGDVTLGAWHRLAFTLSDNGDGTSTLLKYIDGAKVGEQSVDSARFAIDGDNGFLILTDESGETFPGQMSSFLFADRAFSGAEIAATGRADANGILAQPLEEDSAVEFGFNGGDFAPTLGSGSMTPKEATPVLGSAETLGVTPVPDDAGLLSFPAAAPAGGYLVTPGSSGALTSYSLVFDLLVPADGITNAFGALFQTDLSNSGDADFFMRANSASNFGIGISGQYQGSAQFDSWHRIAVTIEDQGDGSATMKKFIDGALVGEQSVDSGRFTIDGDNGFLLLTDESGETFPGYLNSLLVSEETLTEQAIADLGGATTDGILSLPPANGKATQFDFDGESLAASFGDAVMTDRNDSSGGSEPGVKLVNPLRDLLVTPDTENKVLDLTTVFDGEGLTFTIENSDGTVLTVEPGPDGTLELDFALLGFSDIKVTASNDEGESVSDSFRVHVAGPNAFTIAVLPDTQDYTSNPGINDTFGKMTQWLADNAASKNIEFALHVGDVTQNNTPAQWQLAQDAYSKLDGVIPYSVLAGNHDQASGGSAADFSSLITQYFPPEKFGQEAGGTLGGTYKGDMASNYHTFESPDGTKWMVLSLEFGARDDVIRWAGEVIEDHLDHRVILANHYYMNFSDRGNPLSGPLMAEGSGYNYGLVRSPEGATDGEILWRDLVSKYPNVSFTFSGHVFGDGAETLVSYSDYGTPVHQMVVNYQNGVAREIQENGVDGRGGNGGNGAIRLLTIDPDNNTVRTDTYFTEFDEYLTGERDKAEYDRDGLTGRYREHQEVITGIDLGTPDVLAKAKAGDDQFVTAENGAEKAAVTLDAGASIDPDSAIVKYEWLDAEGRVVASGETAQIELTGGRHDLTLVTTDSKGVTNSDTVRIVVSTDDTLLMDNFNDGDFAGWLDNNQAERTPLAEQIAIGTPTSFGIAELPGGDAVVVNFPRSTTYEGYSVKPGFAPASGDVFSQYSMVFDIYFPAQDGNFAAFFQTNVANNDDGDAFLRADGGIGISGNYQGNFTFDTWHRVAFTFEDQGSSLLLRKYIDGEKVGEQTVDPGRFSIDPNTGFLILTDENGEVFEGYLNSFLFTADLLSDEDLAALGGPDADGILDAASAGERSVQFDYNGSFDPSFGSGEIGIADLASGEAAATWKVKGTVASQPEGGDGTVMPEGALYEYSDGAAALIWEDDAALSWSDYSAEVTVLSQDDDGIGLVFYYQDADNHYKLTLDTENNQRQLIKLRDGVETLLAESKQGYPFNREMDLKIAVVGNEIRASLDGQLLFGGPVTDSDNPLTGGTIGLISTGQFQSIFDDVMVNRASVTAHAGSDQQIADLQGDNEVTVTLDAGGAYAPGGIASYVWKDGDTVIATGRTPEVTLPSGQHQITLVVTDGAGKSHEDLVRIGVFNQDQVLLSDDFQDDDNSAWTFVDEGELGDPASWGVTNGALTQSADTYSRELAPNSEAGGVWREFWSPHGDGWHVLRKGAFALYNQVPAEGWSDYAFETDFQASDAGAVGVLFHYRDADNYYKLELDSDDRFVQLVVLKDGIEKSLMLTRNDFELNSVHKLRVEVADHKIQAWLDGMALFPAPIEERSHTSGTIGLYSWGTEGVSFDNVLVRELAAEAAEPEDDLKGTPEDDVIVGTDQDDVITGESGDDDLSGGKGNDDLDGGTGDDDVDGGSGDDLAVGGVGDDNLSGGLGDDDLYGGRGDDDLDGGRGDDNLLGGRGDDLALGGRGDDDIFGERGDDELVGGRGDDDLDGGRGDDIISGGRGDDRLSGDLGDDELDGGRGDDELTGGRGNDVMAGGRGEDLFIFSNHSGSDSVTDFEPGEDHIQLNGFSLADFGDLLAVAQDDGNDVVITLDADQGDQLRLIGVKLEDLSEDGFTFNSGS